MDDPETSPRQKLVPRRGGDRTVSQRPVAFRCMWCGEPVVELRYPGPTPAYGRACAAEARRHADAAKAARRRGNPEPARIVTTSCKGSPTNLHSDDVGAEPDRVKLLVHAPSQEAARAALALLQARLELSSDATPAISPAADGGWEIALRLPLPVAQATEPTSPPPPPEPSLADQSDALPDVPGLKPEDAALYLTEEIANEVRLVTSARRIIRGFLQDMAATKSIGVRMGQGLITELEKLTWRLAHLRIQQAMVAAGMTDSDDAEPLVREAAITRARTVFQLHALRDRLDAQGSLRGSTRAELIALAEELVETAKEKAASLDSVEVTDGAIAFAVWEALDQLPLVPTAHLAPPPPPPRPPRQPRSKQPQAKQPQTKQPQVKSQRLTLEEAARHLSLSTGRVAELARSGELGRKEGGRWTFSEAEVRRVARERADHEKAVKLRKKLENDRRRLNGLPPKRRKKRRKARDYDDDDDRPRRRRGRGLSVDDIGALTMLDQILAQERALQQRYNLPFRAPLQTAARLHRCKRCDAPLVFLIFGERAVDAAGLDAYGRLMEQHITQNGVPAYVLGKANGEGDNAVSLLRRVWPDQGEVVEMTGNRWETFLDEQSRAHDCQH